METVDAVVNFASILFAGALVVLVVKGFDRTLRAISHLVRRGS